MSSYTINNINVNRIKFNRLKIDNLKFQKKLNYWLISHIDCWLSIHNSKTKCSTLTSFILIMIIEDYKILLINEMLFFHYYIVQTPYHMNLESNSLDLYNYFYYTISIFVTQKKYFYWFLSLMSFMLMGTHKSNELKNYFELSINSISMDIISKT